MVDYYSYYGKILGGKEIACDCGGLYCNVAKSLYCNTDFILKPYALQSWIKEKGFAIVGEPVWVRYNPPWTLWFLRRNEILIPVRE